MRKSRTVLTSNRPSRRPRRLILRMGAAVFAVAALLGASGAVRADAATTGSAGAMQATAASLPTYQVTVTGTVSGRAFRQVGTIVLAPTVTNVTTNGVNPLEACLKVGFPAGSPQVGAIWYGSNSACFSSRGANIDMVFAAVSGSTYVTQPDGRLQATYINNWTSSNSIAACAYGPVSGTTSWTFSNTAVSGTINLRGYGGAFCGWSDYVATISGVRIA